MTKGYPDTEQRGLALLNRLQFGFASILAGLKAEANWHRQLRSFFHHEGEGAVEHDGSPRAPASEPLVRAPDAPRIPEGAE